MKRITNAICMSALLVGLATSPASAGDVPTIWSEIISPNRNESIVNNGKCREPKMGGGPRHHNNVLVSDGATSRNRQVAPQIAVGDDHVVHDPIGRHRNMINLGEGKSANGTEPVSAPRIKQESKEQPSTLRVLTYNIHHGRGTDGKFDYDRMARTIEKLNPDVIALQEVDNKTQRANGVNIAAELGERLKMNHVFGNALYFSGGEYGEAVLSRFPIEDAKAHHLPYRFGNEPRTALEVRVTPNNGLPEFIFVGTHLCHQSGETRLEQTKELNKLFTAQSKLPIIMAGDLNARPDSEPMSILLEENWIDAVAPKSQIDYILLRKDHPWEIVETIIADEPIVSDHDPVLTILKWSGK